MAQRFFVDQGFTVRYVPFDCQGKIWRQWQASRKLSATLCPEIVDCAEVIVSGGTIEACVAPARAVKLGRADLKITAYLPMYVDRARAFGLVGRIYNCASRAFVTAIDSFVTINRVQARLIRRHYRRPVSVVRNVIEPVAPPSSNHGPRLIYVGRLDNGQKDVTGLIDLLDDPRNPYRELHIFGDGPDRPAVEARAAEAQHVDVVFHGWVPRQRLGPRLGRRDLLVMNSRWEGEPMIVREMKAAGIPAIGTNIDGFRGILPRTQRFADRRELLDLLNDHHHKAMMAMEGGGR
ncbi:glycosyltransferase [Sphingomonas adhaesiva]|uniref:glycosyltransferase n=1 Tax=Sphingomonas adhaesiva TaxID=28212 RepID=UPI001475ACB8|nr:glycosyltransferase [Sphingomonas adhaesiva]